MLPPMGSQELNTTVIEQQHKYTVKQVYIEHLQRHVFSINIKLMCKFFSWYSLEFFSFPKKTVVCQFQMIGRNKQMIVTKG